MTVDQRRRSDGLIHDGEGIAHGAVAGFGEQGEGGVVDVELFLGGDGAELADDVVELDGVKAEVLAARADGLRNVLGLGGGKHEDGPVGRLFEGLEERVPGGVGDLVRLVEDDDLVLALVGGASLNLGGEQARVVDAAIGGGVDLFDVEGMRLLEDGVLLARGRGDFAAVDADAAGLFRRALGRADGRAAVQCCGEDACDGRLADAAMAGEDVAVSDAVLRERVEQGARDVVLSDDVGEELGAILAG